MSQPTVGVLTPALAALGESPFWDPEGERLWWVDLMESRVFRCAPDGTELSVWNFPGSVSAIARRAGGGLVTAGGQLIAAYDPAAGELELLADFDAHAGLGFNDAKPDRHGGFVTGLADRSLIGLPARGLVGRTETLGRLYRVKAGGPPSDVAGGIALTNGPCFSPDGRTFYCGDSWTREIYAFDYDPTTGAASNRRPFASLAEGVAGPDGATVDDEGCLWVAVFGGSEIRRYAPDGTLDRRVAMPVGYPTSVAFGGSGLDTLYVTSLGQATIPGREIRPTPLGGCVFAVTGLAVRGLEEVPVDV